MHNPYTPPAAPVRDAPPPPRSAIVAVVAGLAIDIGGSTVLGLVQGIIYAVMLAADGMGAEQIQTRLTEPDPSSAYFVVGTLIGYCFSVLGGYVCARLVRRSARRVTGVMAAISGAAGLAMSTAVSFGFVLGVVFTIIQVACVMLGGELGRRRNVARAREAGVPTAA